MHTILAFLEWSMAVLPSPMADPLEQFSIFLLSQAYMLFMKFPSVLNMSFFLFLLLFVIFVEGFSNQGPQNYPTNFKLLQLELFKFVKSIMVDNLRVMQYMYFPMIFAIFVLVLFFNMLGMMPYSFTLTSSFVVTLFISLGLFIGVNMIGWLIHKVRFAGMSLPPGAPLPMSPFLSMVELLSYCARVVSLSTRLFANMMSGHTLMKILAGFSWTMFFNVGTVLFLMPSVIVFIVVGLELTMAFLQAYVFTVLTTLYLNDVVDLH